MFSSKKVIAFDADDTLWINETYFREAEAKFATLLSGYETQNKIDQELFKIHIKNLDSYGYGIKGFVLSMIQCALELSNYQIESKKIEQIINLGKEMLQQPIVLLDGVEAVLQKLQGNYKLIVATKGDLLDQEKKLEQSNLLHYFHHVEVMSNKKEADYKKLLNHLDILPKDFLMIGNSLKSDVLPVVNIGGAAIHVPFHTTWVHEQVAEECSKMSTYIKVNNLEAILEFV